MPTDKIVHPLATIEPRLRQLLPADLYADLWVETAPSVDTLIKTFEHLRTLQQILRDYVPRHVQETLPTPGEVNHERRDGTLMFTNLVDYAPIMEARAAEGRKGAEALLELLNSYFAEMIEIASKSGGNLLEFAGDAILVEFPTHTLHAVRAGLRMQRAMLSRFFNIKTESGTFHLGMRIGIHYGQYVTADIGTPRRMEHILLGSAVQEAKRTESAGEAGRVTLTKAAYEQVADGFTFEEGEPGYMMIVDDISTTYLGDYDLTAPTGRRLSSSLLLDRSVEGLAAEIDRLTEQVVPLAAYIPDPVLNLLVENAMRRQIPPVFPSPTVVFVNLVGPPEAIGRSDEEKEARLVDSFSHAFALINAAVDARGGVLKKVTYDIAGSNIMIFFGVPAAHTDDPIRAADAALAIREIITTLEPVTVGSEEVQATCQIGISSGRTFAAEIGEPRGRREFNVIGDAVNIAARLMGRAVGNRILMTEDVYEAIKTRFECKSLGPTRFKGKSKPVPIYSLEGRPSESDAEDEPESE